MIELRYTGAGKQTPIALTGKGVAFDSGGLSLKDRAGMETMKCDMAGAASILATMRVLALLKPKVNVIARPLVGEHAERLAQRPGDVTHHRGGKTSEALNTDAEGRLILADALAYLVEQAEPRCIDRHRHVNPRMHVALGTDITGAFGNDDALAQELVPAGTEVGEPRPSAAVAGLPQLTIEGRRCEEHREALRRCDHRGAVPLRSSLATRPGCTSTSPVRPSSMARTISARRARPACRSGAGALRAGPRRRLMADEPVVRTVPSWRCSHTPTTWRSVPAVCSPSGRPRDGTSTCSS